MTDLRDAIVTEHAERQMAKREIALGDVLRVLALPDEVLEVRPGRVVAQAMLGDQMLRVFVDVDRHPPEVVTAYRTSKVDKYRSRP